MVVLILATTKYSASDPCFVRHWDSEYGRDKPGMDIDAVKSPTYTYPPKHGVPFFVGRVVLVGDDACEVILDCRRAVGDPVRNEFEKLVATRKVVSNIPS